MAVLEALTKVLCTCGALALQPAGRLSELCAMLKTVLQKKVSGEQALWEEVSDPEKWIVRGVNLVLPTSPSTA